MSAVSPRTRRRGERVGRLGGKIRPRNTKIGRRVPATARRPASCRSTPACTTSTRRGRVFTCRPMRSRRTSRRCRHRSSYSSSSTSIASSTDSHRSPGMTAQLQSRRPRERRLAGGRPAPRATRPASTPGGRATAGACFDAGPPPSAMCNVPVAIGLKLRGASRAIQKARCGVGEVVRKHAAYVPRIVIRAVPKSGARHSRAARASSSLSAWPALEPAARRRPGAPGRAAAPCRRTASGTRPPPSGRARARLPRRPAWACHTPGPRSPTPTVRPGSYRDYRAGQASAILRRVSSRCSGMTLMSASTGMKFVSPFQRGTTWRCQWSTMPAPATLPRLMPTLNPSGEKTPAAPRSPRPRADESRAPPPRRGRRTPSRAGTARP